MHPQTLRQYDRLGLVSPAGPPAAAAATRRATSSCCARCSGCRQDEGVNLAGIKRIIELEQEVARAPRRRVDAQLATELAADLSTALVVWQPPRRAADGTESERRHGSTVPARDVGTTAHERTSTDGEAVRWNEQADHARARRRCRRRPARRRPRQPAGRAGAPAGRPARARPTAPPARCCGRSAPTRPRVREQPTALLARLPARERRHGRPRRSSPAAAARCCTAGRKQAKELGDEYVSTEHLLVGLAAEGGQVGRAAARGTGATAEALLDAFQKVRGAAAGHHRRTPRARTRRWRSTASTSPRAPARASSTRSSAGTPRSAGSSRCCPAAPRTTRC